VKTDSASRTDKSHTRIDKQTSGSDILSYEFRLSEFSIRCSPRRRASRAGLTKVGARLNLPETNLAALMWLAWMIFVDLATVIEDSEEERLCMAKLGDSEIQDKLRTMPGWACANQQIRRRYQFKSFPAAIAFVNKTAEAAERANHHPDIDIRYSTVEISLSTHNEGGITDKDFRLATEIDQIAETIS
jgi:4a-hydroxytetrahydrobiopterin dehydratase